MTITKFTTSFNSSQPSIGLAAITATTGSPTIDTTSRPGKTIYKFTGSGTITVGTAGYAEILVIGAGAGGYASGAGAGGMLYKTSFFLPAGTQTITVGAGSPGCNVSSRNSRPSNGGTSSVAGILYAFGGGTGGDNNGTYTTQASGRDGGSGGGGAYNGYAGLGISGQGNDGGSGNPGGGGGAGGAGGDNVAGAGLANSITGTSVTYSTGGAATGAGAGAANTGQGGGGSSSTGGAGGSGYVVIVTG